MSIQVKTWKPEQGCKSCKQAEKIMHEHTTMAMQTHGKAINKIKEQQQSIAELEQKCAELEISVEACSKRNETDVDRIAELEAQHKFNTENWVKKCDEVDREAEKVMLLEAENARLKERPSKGTWQKHYWRAEQLEQQRDKAVGLLRRLEPHLDKLICYASTRTEHEPNQLVHEVKQTLKETE